MGDSACVLQAFSYTSSAIPHDPNQGTNTVHGLGLGLGLGESVSFGRFMSESLAWEKWSTFSHNRYVEEAERYSQPGSVAQKKAFFEAHYKRIAAKKAAALLEQANNDANANHHPAPPEPQPEPEPKPLPQAETVSDSQPPTAQDFHGQPPEEEEVEVEGGLNSNLATDEEVVEIPPVSLVVKEDSSNLPEISENQGMVFGSDEPQIEKPLLLQQSCSSDQDASSVNSKKKSAFSSLKSSVYRRTSKVPCSPAKPITPRIKKQGSANYDATITPISRKKKQALDFTDKKRATPKSSINTFVNSTPVKQLTNLLSPARSRASRKTDNSSRIAPDSAKMSQNCTTPLGAQNMEPSTKMSKHASVATPCSADTRTKTPVDGNKTAGPKWHILSSVCSKSLTACRNKLQSPTLSTPFILRTEERAARRKQKLEEKFNSKDVEKVQLQTSLKEKAELELRKLRQSFCFKARPLPEFYKEREAQNNQMKKNPVTQPQSPMRTMQDTATASVPTSNAAQNYKNGIFKRVSGKKNGGPPASSLAEMINHENASPNIQQLIKT